MRVSNYLSQNLMIGGSMGKEIGTVLVIALTLSLFVNSCTWTDSSDRSWHQRSQMAISVDALTGCHYFRTWTGAITPRMWSDGKQVCIGFEDEQKSEETYAETN